MFRQFCLYLQYKVKTTLLTWVCPIHEFEFELEFRVEFDFELEFRVRVKISSLSCLRLAPLWFASGYSYTLVCLWLVPLLFACGYLSFVDKGDTNSNSNFLTRTHKFDALAYVWYAKNTL